MPISSRLPRSLSISGLTVLLTLVVLATTASARELYIPNTADSVSVFDVATGQPVGAPIQTGVGTEPFSLTISPDGRIVYAANYGTENISVIGTQQKAKIAPEIKVGEGPIGIAISQDGSRGYVANSEDGTVSVIDLVARQVVGTPIDVGGRPENPVLTPDGKRLYVPNYGGGYVSVIDTTTNQLVGQPIVIGPRAYVAAVTPNGQRVFVTSIENDALYVIDTATNQLIGAPIPVGDNPSGVTISPDGTRAYVASYGSETVDIVDTQALTMIGQIQNAGEAEFVVLNPDGKKGFTTNYSDNRFFAFDPLASQILGPAFPAGSEPGVPGVVPNQPPVAVLSKPVAKVRPGVAASLSAAGSVDPDGIVANFAWTFGDGGVTASATATATHTYAKPGTYTVGVTLTDNEGCSTSYIATSPTPFCNGSAVATTTMAVSVAYPGVRASCPKSAKPGGCKITLQAVAWKGKGKKRQLKAQSVTTRISLKAGKSAVASLKPKKAARKKLAKARKILIRQTVTIAGEKHIRVGKLKVVK